MWKEVAILLVLAQVASCKPEKPPMDKYRVSLKTAVGSQAKANEEEFGETVAFIGDKEISLNETVLALKSLPPFKRFFFSNADKAKQFIMNYVLVDLAASKAVSRHFHHRANPRISLLKSVVEQIRNDYLADKIRAQDGAGDDMSKRREQAWQSYVEKLRHDTQVDLAPEAVDQYKKTIADRNRQKQDEK